jgi:uridine kinase
VTAPDVEHAPAEVERLLADRGPRLGGVRLVCVDGPSGAGKTTFAAMLAERLAPAYGDVPVVHGDDVYEGWDVVAGAGDPVTAFAALGDRLHDELLAPWADGRDAAVRRWAWRSDRWGAPRVVAPAPVVFLEGVGLAGPRLRDRATVVVWLDADPDERLRRVLARDGVDVEAHLQAWRDGEDAWHRHDRTAEHADVVVRTES